MPLCGAVNGKGVSWRWFDPQTELVLHLSSLALRTYSKGFWVWHKPLWESGIYKGKCSKKEKQERVTIINAAKVECVSGIDLRCFV